MQTQKSFEQNTNIGTLYLVPTPIGNLDDMTFRTINILKEVDLIAAEDTRNTAKLLNHFEIHTHQISFHEHNTQSRIPELIGMLKEGQSIAQVSDAGMPSISDPGKELVAACIDANITVVPLPGANAALTALIASGISPQPFMFYGFLPRKNQEQKDALVALAKKPETVILYEAPHRLKQTLKVLQKAFGEDRKAALCRELTKKHEEFIRGTLDELLQWATETEIRGEFVIIISGNDSVEDTDDKVEEVITSLPVTVQVQRYIDQGMTTNDAIKKVAKDNGVRKQVIYNQYHNL
ncbi:16S rRNA (cytidine(1402)-2'-O)-methyltransferase [Lentilactobacillus sp. Marseille-Q4993]|uniref:16S rRNA (cytidine(1402)-2'-O)-methyltransferase n=1 Tax=Lentilactobacillus sp. Marseille-Q4993 TaxID=3039492 RepID=UPI0024BC04B9|nr:16S rRNA (cytidine(1402)-2'-O)-methyltransferase [Lentilactobacillus sp. Marseille-Q4993]